jgi:hypothetical protein
LATVQSGNTPVANVVPTSSGGVQLEWHAEGIDFEVNTKDPYRLSAYFYEKATGEEWEEEITTDWTRITATISEMTARRERKLMSRGA